MSNLKTQDLGFNFQSIVEYAQDIIVVTKADLINSPGPEIVYVNEAFINISGYSRDEVIGKTPRILQTRHTDQNARKKIREALEQKQPVRTIINNYSKTGQEYWLDLSILPLKNEHGEVTHFVAIQRDFTQHKILEEKLHNLSLLDSLTQLHNYGSFNNLSNIEFLKAKRKKSIYSMLMLDIDFFKKVNDTHGHVIGDLTLKNFALLCKNNINSHDILARVGGEEFCILLPNTTKNNALKIAEKLRNLTSQTPLINENKNISITISIGVAVLQDTDVDYKDIIKRADQALYCAKTQGRDRICC